MSSSTPVLSEQGFSVVSNFRSEFYSAASATLESGARHPVRNVTREPKGESSGSGSGVGGRPMAAALTESAGNEKRFGSGARGRRGAGGR